MRNCCYAHHQPSIRKPQKKTRPFSYCCCCYIIRSYISNSSLRTTNNRTEKSTATIWWVRDVHKLGLLVKKKGRRRYILDFRSERPIGTSPPGTCICFNIPHLCATFSNTADDFFFFVNRRETGTNRQRFLLSPAFRFRHFEIVFFYSSTSLL